MSYLTHFDILYKSDKSMLVCWNKGQNKLYFSTNYSVIWFFPKRWHEILHKVISYNRSLYLFQQISLYYEWKKYEYI